MPRRDREIAERMGTGTALLCTCFVLEAAFLRCVREADLSAFSLRLALRAAAWAERNLNACVNARPADGTARATAELEASETTAEILRQNGHTPERVKIPG